MSCARIAAHVCAVALLASSAQAATLHVPADYPTIQTAFDSSAVGDSIIVGPGTYPGLVAASGGRTLVGRDGADATVIDAGGETACLYGLPSDFNLLIEGFTFLGCEPSYGFSDAFDVGFTGPGSVELRACVMSGENGAIFTGAETRVMGCEIRNGGGIFFQPDSYGASLVVEDCLFENNVAKNHDGEAAIIQIVQIGNPDVGVSIRNCILRHNQNGYFDRPIIGFDYPYYYSRLEFELLGCVIYDNEGPVVGLASLSVNRPSHSIGMGGEEVYIHNNTIVRSGGLELHELGASPTGISVEFNLITGGQVGVVMPPGATHATCNDVWGNQQNWVGIPDQTGISGNMSVAPLFCNPALDDYSLAENSPCLLPGLCGARIGALGQGCGTVSVESKSWGQIKGLYR